MVALLCSLACRPVQQGHFAYYIESFSLPNPPPPNSGKYCVGTYSTGCVIVTVLLVVATQRLPWIPSSALMITFSLHQP